ncbi:MAG: O-methyltransferase [Acidimicrobiaceae bacterium]|nr:O-methyltransferase [Acidimicrobiaceae bacterium]
MANNAWPDVDAYVRETVLGSDPVMDAILAANAAAGLPAIDVSAPQGKLLALLVRLVGAHRVLEVGTLGGYSTVWMARALPPGGQLVTLEINEDHARVARANVERAGVAGEVEVRLGPALSSLPAIAAEAAPPFDLVFIDADKPSNPQYLEWALKLTRPGSVIVVDNVIRNGQVLDASSRDPTIAGTRQVLEMIGADPRLDATALQMVGSKGWDGFALAVVRSL